MRKPALFLFQKIGGDWQADSSPGGMTFATSAIVAQREK
jgi:hypothetical protein